MWAARLAYRRKGGIMELDFADLAGARAVVLVEGASDKAALDVLAERRGLAVGGAGLRILAMGGVTNIGKFAAALGPRGLGVRLAGLCDEGEEAHVRRALSSAGLAVTTSRDQLEALGFYVCVTDLEDELIRAHGVAGVERVISAQGDLKTLHMLRRQPAQQGRSAEMQLHRFMGSKSGRKSQYARLLAGALEPSQVPRSLDLVLAQL